MPDIKIKVKDFDVEASPALTDYAVNERVGGSGKQPKRTLWSSILTMLQNAGVSVETYESGISAAGTNQATATVLTKNFTRVDTVGSGTGVIEPTALLKRGRVANNGLNDLKFYPQGSNKFYDMSAHDFLSPAAPFTIAPGNSIDWVRYESGVLTIY